jgi:glycosyltransferase involved in cell wall biosynthesis
VSFGKMKILMLYKTKTGGVARYVYEVKKQLIKHGYDVIEITRNEELNKRSFLLSFKVLREIKKIKVDVIHTHDWSITYPVLGYKNLVATFHGLPTNPIAKLFQDYSIFRLKEKAIVVSPKMKKAYPMSTLILEGVDLNEFRPKKLDRIFDIGVCQSYNLNEIKKITEELDMSLYIVRNMSFNHMPNFYNKIKIFISLPPHTTGFNLSWLEAMACETPYIIGNNVGIGEILPIYKIRNFNELRSLLLKIKNGEIKPLKRQRRWIIKNKLTWEEHVKKLIEVYSKI